MSELKKTIARLYSEGSNLTAVSDTKLKIGARTFTATQFLKHFSERVLDFMSKMTGEELMEFNEIRQSKVELENLSDRIFSMLVKRAMKDVREKIKEATVIDKTGDSYSYADHFQVIDVKSGERALFNASKGNLTDLEIESWKEWLNSLDKQTREGIKENTVWGRISYDPYDRESTKSIIVEDQSITEYNAHIFPEWRKKELTDPVLPKEFKEFMDFFFPEKDSRAYALTWMKYMLIDRNECHLLLHGKKGVGKNTFASICERLVGIENAKVIDPKFWDSRFNGELKYKRLCFFDEHDITKDNINQFKAYANGYLSIEEKNVKVEKNYKNYASFIIANNNPGGNFLSSDDRRFSVPIITHERFDSFWTKDKIAEFNDIIKNDDSFIANIGWWLIKKNKSEYDNFTPFKSDLFYELVENSMTEWQRKLIDLLQSGEVGDEGVELNQLPLLLDGVNNIPGRSKIASFLDNNTDRDGRYYGRLVRTTGNKTVLKTCDPILKKEEVVKEEEKLDLSGF